MEKEKFAIVGMAGRFPGAKNIDEFWKNLCEGRESLTFFKDEDLLNSGVQPHILSRENYVKANAILDNIEYFDADFFGYTQQDAEMTDPQIRLFLECAYLSLENAGYFPQKYAGKVGVFAGMRISEYMLYNLNLPDLAGLYSSSMYKSLKKIFSNDKDQLSLRVSHALNLTGPSISVQTACSTSLVATHLACQSLARDECDMAVVGGAIVRVPQKAGYEYLSGMLFSPDGHTRPFDKEARGTIFSSGVGAVVLKRLDKALKDRDFIYATIVGSAVNNNGASTSSYFSPSISGQLSVIDEALRKSRIKAESISYLEAHGTATLVGDPVEIEALTRAFRKYTSKKQFCALGSVKANIGHTTHASGIASLIKTALMLKNRQLTPQINFSTANPKLKLPESPFYVNTKLKKWNGEKLIAGISSFGVGGTNAHVILENSPPITEKSKPRSVHLFQLSAHCKSSLENMQRSYADYIRGTNDSFADICFTSNISRSYYPYRISILAENKEELHRKISTSIPQKVTKDKALGIAFLFTGQGSQYVGMGRSLYDKFTVYRESINRCDQLFRKYIDKSIVEVMFDETSNAIHETLYTQCTIFSIQYALCKLYRELGIEPDVVMGHSLGEYAAACICGGVDLEDVIYLIATRGKLMNELPQNGGMYAVLARHETVVPFLVDYRNTLSVAAHNGPESIVISGDLRSLQKVVAALTKKGISTQQLNVSHAFHSPLISPILKEFREQCCGTSFHKPQVEFVSTMTGDFWRKSFDVDYWCEETKQPVRFVEAMNKVQEKADVFLEIGPHPILLNMAQKFVSEGTWISALHKKNVDTFLHSIQQLYYANMPVRWDVFDRTCLPRRVLLPEYCFAKKRYWLKEETSMSFIVKGHPLLGERIPCASQVIFQQKITSTLPEYLQGHCIQQQCIYPGSAYVEMIVAASKELYPDVLYSIEELIIHKPLFLNSDCFLQTILTPTDKKKYDIQIFVTDDLHSSQWQKLCTGKIAPAFASNMKFPPQKFRDKITKQISQNVLRASQKKRGLDYSGVFQSPQRIWFKENKILGHLKILDSANDHYIHPAILDGGAQCLGALFVEKENSAFSYLPFCYEDVRVYDKLGNDVWCYVNVLSDINDDMELQLTFVDNVGKVVAEVSKLHLKKVKKLVHKQSDDLYYLSWKEQALTKIDNNKDEDWVVFCDDDIAPQLISKLRGRVFTIYEEQNYSRTENSITIDPININHYQDVWKDICAKNPKVIFLWDLNEEIGVERFSQVQHSLYLLQSLASCEIKCDVFFITSGGQSIGGGYSIDPIQAMIPAVAKVVNSETNLLLHCTTIDIDPYAQEQNIADIFCELQRSTTEDIVAFRMRNRYVQRMVKYHREKVSESNEVLRGTDVLSDLQYHSSSRREPLAHEIEIAVCATGLNFRDIMNALGKYPGNSLELGNECSGIVTGIGSDVQNMQVGDCVIAMAGGSFCNYVYVNSLYAVKKSDLLSFEEGATIPLVFVTAYYGLCYCADLRKEDTVLIHAGAGGVGLAAIQIAQSIGAKIIASAHRGKWQYLRSLGVQNIVDSRSLDFAKQVFQLNEGRGVDVILNSLSGDFLRKSFDILETKGRFVEIGKIDIWSKEQVQKLNKKIAYFPFDLGDVARKSPQFFNKLLSEVVQKIENNSWKIIVHKIYKKSDVEIAFRYMANAQHIGKIIVKNNNEPWMNFTSRNFLLSPHKSYLISGGCGGVGLAMAQYLVSNGAKHLILVGRSQPKEAAKKIIQKLCEEGCVVTIRELNIGDEKQVQELFGEIKEHLPELGGVLHNAGIENASAFHNVPWENFAQSYVAKVKGTYFLHRYASDVEFFIMASTLSSFEGTRGLSSYASANAFIDAMAHYRRQQFLPSTSINWSAWAEVGMAARQDKKFRDRRSERGIIDLDPRYAMELFSAIVDSRQTQLVALKMDWEMYEHSKHYNQLLFNKLLTKNKQNAQRRNQDIIEELDGLSTEEQISKLEQYLCRKVKKISGYDLKWPDEVDKSLYMALDSLTTIEIRNELEKELGIKISPILINSYSTIKALAQYFYGQIAARKL